MTPSTTPDLAEQVAAGWDAIREQRPLIHHITNFVVMNETANATLCIGALPVMAHAVEEVEEMVGAAGALVLNIGTLTPELVDSMIAAGRKANELGVPVILDPVGAGATVLRTDATRRLTTEVHPAIVRGNAAEIATLGGYGAEIRGVESMGVAVDPKTIALETARKLDVVVAVTGAADAVCDGSRTFTVENGHPILGTVTGTGCMATTVVAGFAAVEPDAAMAAAGGLVAFGLAGERAAQTAAGPGSFHVALYDALAALTADDIRQGARINLVGR